MPFDYNIKTEIINVNDIILFDKIEPNLKDTELEFSKELKKKIIIILIMMMKIILIKKNYLIILNLILKKRIIIFVMKMYLL